MFKEKKQKLYDVLPVIYLCISAVLENVKNSYMQLTLIFQQQHEIEATSLCFDPLLEAHHPLRCVCLL